MRALILENYGSMIVDEVADPIPLDGDILIDVVATGICGSDLHGYTGENGRRFPGQIMGHESVGRVSAMDSGLHGLAPGTIVTFNPLLVTDASRTLYAGREQHAPDRSVIGVEPQRPAAFAERIVVPATNVVQLPESIPIAWGALIEPLAVALNAAKRVAIADGDSALVIGGGPIGQSAILAALHLGASPVYVSEPDPARRALCESLGAIALDPEGGPIDEQILALGSALVDVTLDAVGLSATVGDALRATTFGGRICLVGMGSKRLELDAYRISTEERSIVGSFTYSFDVFTQAAAWVASGDALFGSLISEEVPLAEAPAAFARLSAGDNVAGKVLVRLDL
jgi:threonine dehydrogenase-like Zn-dependent dehydrogenase